MASVLLSYNGNPCFKALQFPAPSLTQHPKGRTATHTPKYHATHNPANTTTHLTPNHPKHGGMPPKTPQKHAKTKKAIPDYQDR